jgi:hypothetical protein
MDMHFTKSILIPCEFACPVIDPLMLIAPPVINIVFIRIHLAASKNGLGNNGLDCGQLDIGQHLDYPFSVALQQAKDRGFFTYQGAPTTFPAEFSPSFG